MKKIIFIISFIIITLTSCQITEKIYFENDGSGKYSLEINMSEMMKSLGDLNSEKKIDSNYVVTDSILNFDKLFLEHKDSIAKLPKEKREELEKLKGMEMIIHEDKINMESWIRISKPFKSADEIDDIQASMNSLNTDKKTLPSKYNIEYIFKKNKFIRKSIQKQFNTDEQKQFDEGIKNFDMFLGRTTYNLEYHFPKKIKKANLKDVKLSKDRKTIYIQKPITDWINNGESFDFELKFSK